METEVSPAESRQSVKDSSIQEANMQEECIDPIHSLSDVALGTKQTEKCDENGNKPSSKASTHIADDPANQAGSAMHTPDPDPNSDARTSGKNADEPAIYDVNMEVSGEMDDVGQTCTGASENSSVLDNSRHEVEKKLEEEPASVGDEGSTGEVRVQPEDSLDEQNKSNSNIELK